MKSKILWVKYQKLMFYAAVFGGELSKPMRFLTEFSMLVLVTKLVLGYEFTAAMLVCMYLALLSVAIIAGYILVKTGTAKLNNTISNKQNPQMMEILKTVKRIERRRR